VENFPKENRTSLLQYQNRSRLPLHRNSSIFEIFRNELSCHRLHPAQRSAQKAEDVIWAGPGLLHAGCFVPLGWVFRAPTGLGPTAASRQGRKGPALGCGVGRAESRELYPVEYRLQTFPSVSAEPSTSQDWLTPRCHKIRDRKRKMRGMGKARNFGGSQAGPWGSRACEASVRPPSGPDRRLPGTGWAGSRCRRRSGVGADAAAAAR
ncbi:hypothetical protein P7K49_013038, partial [Saguinus oedipus]